MLWKSPKFGLLYCCVKKTASEMYSLNHNICFALSPEHVRGQREIWLLEVKFLSCGLVHGSLAVRRGAGLGMRALYRQLLAQHRLQLMVLGQQSTWNRWRTRAKRSWLPASQGTWQRVSQWWLCGDRHRQRRRTKSTRPHHPRRNQLPRSVRKRGASTQSVSRRGRSSRPSMTPVSEWKVDVWTGIFSTTLLGTSNFGLWARWYFSLWVEPNSGFSKF